MDNTPRYILDKLPNARVHAILATGLVLDQTEEFKIWRAVLPTRDEIHALMPFCWPPELQALLPAAAATALVEQRANFNEDWAMVQEAFGDEVPKDDFVYSWLLVNTRTFYHTSRRTKDLPNEDHMILQPIADLLNHSSHGCSVSYDEREFTVTTVREHQAGEELFISYGAHSNDRLLVEYGFMLAPVSNPWDEVCIDPYIIPELLAANLKENLTELDYWANYMIDDDTACYRTEIALRALLLTPHQLQDVLDGQRDEDLDRESVDRKLLAITRACDGEIDKQLAELVDCSAGTAPMRNMLSTRWKQIQKIVRANITRLERQVGAG